MPWKRRSSTSSRPAVRARRGRGGVMSTGRRTTYARLLRLRHLRPSQLTTFILFEGSFLIAIVLALAELIHWWGVLLIPATVAVMVKFNDAVAGALARPAAIAQLVR